MLFGVIVYFVMGKNYLLIGDDDECFRKLKGIIVSELDGNIVGHFADFDEVFENKITSSVDMIIGNVSYLDTLLLIQKRLKQYLGDSLRIIYAVDFEREIVEYMHEFGLNYIIRPFHSEVVKRTIRRCMLNFSDDSLFQKDVLGKQNTKIVISTKRQDFYLCCSDLLFVFVDHGVVHFVSHSNCINAKVQEYDYCKEYYRETSAVSRKEVLVRAISKDYNVLRSSKDLAAYQEVLISAGFSRIGKSILVNMHYLTSVNRNSQTNKFGGTQNMSTCTLKKDSCNIILPIDRDYRMRIQKNYVEQMSY